MCCEYLSSLESMGERGVLFFLVDIVCFLPEAAGAGQTTLTVDVSMPFYPGKGRLYERASQKTGGSVSVLPVYPVWRASTLEWVPRCMMKEGSFRLRAADQ